MKMYFVVKEDVPLGLAMVGVAHGAMIAEMRWGQEGCPESRQSELCQEYKEWKKSFKKVIVRATEEEFSMLTDMNGPYDRFTVTESSIGGKETVVVYHPHAAESKILQELPLYNQKIKDSVDALADKQKEAKREHFETAFNLSEACLMEDYEAVKLTLWESLKKTPQHREKALKALNDSNEESMQLLKHLRKRATDEYQKYYKED